MSRTVALVLMSPDYPDAQPFRNAIESDPILSERIELRFAVGDEALKAVRDAEIVACSNVTPDLLLHGDRLRWIAFWSAGLDNKLFPELIARNLLLTSANGVHGPNIAEHVMMWMLMFTRRMPFYQRMQHESRWERNPAPIGPTHRNRGLFLTQDEALGELAGQTLGIVGLGRIGEALTLRAKAFEMRVVALKRDPEARYDARIQPDRLYGPDSLPQLLEESDHVCIAVPYTPQTHHLFNASMLAHLKPTAYLYNIARGRIIDEAALIEALETEKLAGAGLDVFETEPLPPKARSGKKQMFSLHLMSLGARSTIWPGLR